MSILTNKHYLLSPILWNGFYQNTWNVYNLVLDGIPRSTNSVKVGTVNFKKLLSLTTHTFGSSLSICKKENMKITLYVAQIMLGHKHK